MSDPPAPSGGCDLQLVLFARVAGAGAAGRARAPQVARRVGARAPVQRRPRAAAEARGPSSAPGPRVRGSWAAQLRLARAGPRRRPGTRGWSRMRPVARAGLTEARGRSRCGPGPCVWPPPPHRLVLGAPSRPPRWECAAPPPAPGERRPLGSGAGTGDARSRPRADRPPSRLSAAALARPRAAPRPRSPLPVAPSPVAPSGRSPPLPSPG